MITSSNKPFAERRRQKFADEAAFSYADNFFVTKWAPDMQAWCADQSLTLKTRANYATGFADLSFDFLVRSYTSGADIDDVRANFSQVVERYVQAAKLERELSGEPAMPAFDFTHKDDYARLVALLSLAILLHREDQISAVYSLFKDGAPDKTDALVEDLLSRYLPDRPFLDTWYHEDPYIHLLDATAETPEQEKQADLLKYLKAWYAGMKGVAWHDSHKRQTPKSDGGYFGYWAFEAAAVAYLYQVDDKPFRDQLVYPKDLADFARSMPRTGMPELARSEATNLRCDGGKPCPRDGWWFTPARQDSRKLFKAGEPMPIYASDYGLTIWQWDANQAA